MFRFFVLVLGAVSLLPPSFAGGQTRQDLQDAYSRMDQALSVREELSAADSYFIGRAVGANILRLYRPYTANPALLAYLQDICDAITVNSPRPEFYNGYHLMILDTPEVNALTTSGGHIFITRGFIGLADSEDALAAIIAHEIAHIQLEHSVELINRMSLTWELTDEGRRAAETASRNLPEKERILLFGNSVNEMINTLIRKGYSRTQELEADVYAAGLLAGAGYDPRALTEILRLLQNKAAGRSPEGLNATHPSPAQRIANLQPVLARYPASGSSSYRKSRFINRVRP
ncbi:MAG: M48 family metalloprotease [Treponema sp.]|jgi:predicted Zn-dependent protease|nr:M48 family metalloprotease [Treponema sp.]